MFQSSFGEIWYEELLKQSCFHIWISRKPSFIKFKFCNSQGNRLESYNTGTYKPIILFVSTIFSHDSHTDFFPTWQKYTMYNKYIKRMVMYLIKDLQNPQMPVIWQF